MSLRFSRMHAANSLPEIMTDLIFKLTVNQLATTIRLYGAGDESIAMLNMLETLVIAGEIPFADFYEPHAESLSRCIRPYRPGLACQAFFIQRRLMA